MTRLFCLTLAVVLAISFSVQAQPNNPPKNFTNSIGMKFVWIPPGTFMMGSPKEEKGRYDDDCPARRNGSSPVVLVRRRRFT